VHARRRFGVSVLYPQLLQRLGYVGTLHAALGEGRYPEGSQVKIRWQGPDHTAIDTVGRVPLDAARPETFLKLASKLGETMDMDHVATLCLAHWPGQVSPWYHDLRRIARYGAMLGKFVTVDQYFRDTDYPGTSEKFQTDQYQSPYLGQAVSRQQHDPISTSVRYWRRQMAKRAAQTLETLVALVTQRPPDARPGVTEQVDLNDEQGDEWERQHQVQKTLDDQLTRAAELVQPGDGPPHLGYVLFNPSTVVRRVGLDLPQLSGPPETVRPVYAATALAGHHYVVADIPAMGYAWIQGSVAASDERRSGPLLVEGPRLCNEYFEAHVNPATGALQSLREFEKRGNRLSQQLALRMPRTAPGRQGPAATYSVMAADSVEATVATSVMGEITSAGRLLNARGEVLARFRQRFRVWRGSRVLGLSIELEPLAHSGDDPWNSYYACRFAWADETASLWRGAPELRERAEAKRFEAPLYVEVDDSDGRVAILTGGLPFHRRTDARMLDSLLVVRGERAQHFEIGIGMDVKYPWHEATALLAPPLLLPRTAGPPRGPAHSWLFHVDSRNLAATSWTSVVQEGRVTGFRVRLLETGGRTVHTRLSAFRPIGSAHKVDFAGQSLGVCPVRDGTVELDVGAHEWVELEARW
jgi:alpha-mannosidase